MSQPSDNPPVMPSDDDQIDHEMEAQIAARRKRWMRIGLFTGLGVVVVGLLLALTLLIMWRSQPGYWKRNQAFLASKSPAELKRMAEDLERRIMHEVFEPEPAAGAGENAGPSAALSPDTPARQSGVQHVHVSLEEINAWLAMRAPAWAANRGITIPGNVDGMMLTTDQGELVLACRAKGSVEQVFSMRLNVQIDDAGMARVQVVSLHTGSLPIPQKLVTFGAGRVSPMLEQRTAMAFDGITTEAVVRVDSRRKLRLMNFTPGADALDLTLRSEPRTPESP